MGLHQITDDKKITNLARTNTYSVFQIGTLEKPKKYGIAIYKTEFVEDITYIHRQRVLHVSTSL